MELLYASRDNGSTWRLVATNGFGGPRTAPGRLGWTGSAFRVGPKLLATADGRLFALGDTATYHGVYCSVDGGLSWSTACPAQRAAAPGGIVQPGGTMSGSPARPALPLPATGELSGRYLALVTAAIGLAALLVARIRSTCSVRSL